MKVSRRFVVVVAVLLASANALYSRVSWAQGTGTIQGTVRSESGPLEGVTVTIVGTLLGSTTRADGKYTISNVPGAQYTVRATRIGYARQELPVTVAAGTPVTLNFDLKTAAIALDQVVVTGYGSLARRDVTGSIGSITSADIATLPVPRIDQAISGMIAGVQVQTTNAQPGSEMRIRVRGGNSLNGSNEPLVVVDGVIGADLNQINPSDVETVDVLKDASATAIYGARGANGVIIVSTKRGAAGAMKFSYTGYAGSQQVSQHIDVLNANEFAKMFMRNPNHDKSVTYDTTANLPSTDWQKSVFENAPMQSHDLRVSGSNGGTSILAGVSLFQQDGIVSNSRFNRGSVRFNLDQQLGKKITAGTRVTFSRSTGNAVRVNDGYGTAGGPVTMAALRFAPTIPILKDDGSFSAPLLPSQTLDNPVAIVSLLNNKTTTNYLLGNAFATIELLPHLNLRSSVSYTSSDAKQQIYTSRLLRAALGSGQANINTASIQTFLNENTLTLRENFGKSDFTVLGGVTAQTSKRDSTTAQGVGFTSDLLGYNRLNLAQTVTAGSSSASDRLLSGFARINYGYDGKYLLTATYRADGASKFAVNNKWAYFPSFAAAWRLSDEGFMKKIGAITELKLRGGIGQTGSDAVSPYQSLGAWSVGSPYDIGTTTFNNGANPSRNANPNLKWETTTQTDAGFDLGLFSNRVSITADAYSKTTRDLLYAKLVPYYTGYTSYITNIGSVENKGLEIIVDTRHHVGPVSLQLGGNISWNKSKVLDLGGDKEFFVNGVNTSLPTFIPGGIVRIGQPLGNFFGYIWDGIFQTAAEATASGQSGALPGGMKLHDVNGDGKISTDDRVILGNALPKYTFGQNGTVGWRSLTMTYLLRGVQGNKVANLNRQGMETPGDVVNTLTKTLNYWTPGSGIQNMTGIGIQPFNAMTSRWVEDGSFVRLQNVTVSWQVPSRLIQRANIQSLRMYLSGQNLKTWTKYSWFDPEASSRGTSDLQIGWDDSSYPGVRTFTFGLSVGY
ncbi:MAG: TonB-dependent receptor [Gemmatimonadaceae bacterium]